MRQRLLSGILIDLRQLAGIRLLELPLQLTLVLLQILHGQQVGLLVKTQASLQTLPGILPGILVILLAKAPAKALIHRGPPVRALHKALLQNGLPLGLPRGQRRSLPILRLLPPLALANQQVKQQVKVLLLRGQQLGIQVKVLTLTGLQS